MFTTIVQRFPAALYFFPVFAALAITGCSDSGGGVLTPGGEQTERVQPPAVTFSDRIPLDVILTVKEGKNPDSPLLTGASGDSTADSLNLYIDVAMTNVGSDSLYLPERGKDVVLQAKVRFVDLPLKKNFDHGRLKLVIGWTNGGLLASEVLETEFGTDSVATFAMPLSRVDSLHVADNVAVYGVELADNRYIHATRVVRFEGPGLPKNLSTPAMVGYVQRYDLDANRLYVSGATVVIVDSTRIEDADGSLLSLDMLTSGGNELTITGLAWAYTEFSNMIANGWKFTRFSVQVARPLSL